MRLSNNFMAVGAAMALGAASRADDWMDHEPSGWPTDPPVYKRRSPPYVPPPPSEEIVNERLRLAAAKRARKAAKLKGGE